MLKDLFKGSAIYGLAPFVPRIISILLLPVLTKYLTSIDYGIIGTITAITFAVESLRDLGLRVLLPIFYYKCPSQYKIAWREIYGFLSVWMVFFALIQATVLYLFIPEEAEENKWYIILFSNFATVLFGPTSIIGSTYYQLSLKPMPVAIRTVISAIVTILVNFICVVVYKWGYMGAYVGSFVGTFFVNISYWPVVNRKLNLSPIYNFKWRTINKMLKVGIPTIPHAYTGYLINSSCVVAMNMYKVSQSDIGYFTMAKNMSNIFDSIVYAINQVFSPMCCKYIKENNVSEIKRLLYSYILMTYALTFFYSVWAREFYNILISNDEIAATYKYSIGLVMACNSIPVYIYCCTYFFYHEKTARLLLITFIAGMVSCLLYFAIIPFMGINGAIIGLYIGCIYQGYSGYFFSFYNRKTIYKVRWQLLLLLQLLLTAVAYLCVDLNVLTKVVISITSLVILAYLFVSKVLNGNYNLVMQIKNHKQ